MEKSSCIQDSLSLKIGGGEKLYITLCTLVKIKFGVECKSNVREV